MQVLYLQALHTLIRIRTTAIIGPKVAFAHASAIFAGTAHIDTHQDDCDVEATPHLCRPWTSTTRDIDHGDLGSPELLSVKVLLYLQSHESSTGGISFLRGSHKMDFQQYRVEKHRLAKEDFEYIPSKVGDVIFFDGRTVCRVGQLAGQDLRASIQMTFIDAAHPF